MPPTLTARVAAFVGTFAVVSTAALADDPKRDNAPAAGVTAAKEKKGLDAATRASGGEEAVGDRGPPKPEKTWDEMTPQEQDAARKRWLLNSGDFGPRGGIPRATRSPSTDKGGAVIDGPRPRTPQEKIRTK